MAIGQDGSRTRPARTTCAWANRAASILLVQSATQTAKAVCRSPDVRGNSLRRRLGGHRLRHRTPGHRRAHIASVGRCHCSNLERCRQGWRPSPRTCLRLRRRRRVSLRRRALLRASSKEGMEARVRPASLFSFHNKERFHVKDEVVDHLSIGKGPAPARATNAPTASAILRLQESRRHFSRA